MGQNCRRWFRCYCPFGLGALGKGLGKGAVKAGAKIAAGTAGKGGATLANLLKGGATVANWGAKTGLGRTVATGVGTQLGKGQANAVETDLKQQAETADIMNSDLVTGKYLDTLLGDLNTETVSEYDKYAQDLAIKEEQDKANAVYSGMNAGNAGLSNLLKGNIANAYSQLSKQALGELAKQKSSNKLSAMNQTDNQFNSLLSLAQSTGNSDLLEKLLLAKNKSINKR